MFIIPCELSKNDQPVHKEGITTHNKPPSHLFVFVWLKLCDVCGHEDAYKSLDND